MKKINSILFTAILALTSGSIFAESICDYPQHFKIVGGKILELTTQQPNSELTVIMTSEDSFDVIDNTQCKNNGSGIRGIKLKVGLDNIHVYDMIFADSTSGKITRVYANSLNNYMLDEINRVTATDYQLVYNLHS